MERGTTVNQPERNRLSRVAFVVCTSVVTLLVMLLGFESLIPFCSYASTVIPMDLEGCVSYSSLAFAGTVSSKATDWTDEHSTIVTRVTFADLYVVKGAAGSTVTLTFEGGRVGDEEILVPGQPSFEAGRRYVVLSDADRGSSDNSYSPTIGLYQGYYNIGLDGIVADWAGRKIVGVRDGHALVLQEEPSPQISVKPQRVSGLQDMYELGSRASSESDSSEVESRPPVRKPQEISARTSRTWKPREKPTKTYAVPRPSPVPLELVTAKNDPGTRVHEQLFLSIIKSFASK
ncbi:MAG TPA: hypothetical protein VKM96_06075 [Candidatus Bathyarchaeia archaeon]|nr:hypothetical protein [Candidatus Bathyarchaeia archaeon]